MYKTRKNWVLIQKHFWGKYQVARGCTKYKVLSTKKQEPRALPAEGRQEIRPIADRNWPQFLCAHLGGQVFASLREQKRISLAKQGRRKEGVFFLFRQPACGRSTTISLRPTRRAGLCAFARKKRKKYLVRRTGRPPVSWQETRD